MSRRYLLKRRNAHILSLLFAIVLALSIPLYSMAYTLEDLGTVSGTQSISYIGSSGGTVDHYMVTRNSSYAKFYQIDSSTYDMVWRKDVYYYTTATGSTTVSFGHASGCAVDGMDVYIVESFGNSTSMEQLYKFTLRTDLTPWRFVLASGYPVDIGDPVWPVSVNPTREISGLTTDGTYLYAVQWLYEPNNGTAKIMKFSQNGTHLASGFFYDGNGNAIRTAQNICKKGSYYYVITSPTVSDLNAGTNLTSGAIYKYTISGTSSLTITYQNVYQDSYGGEEEGISPNPSAANLVYFYSSAWGSGYSPGKAYRLSGF